MQKMTLDALMLLILFHADFQHVTCDDSSTKYVKNLLKRFLFLYIRNPAANKLYSKYICYKLQVAANKTYRVLLIKD